MFAHFLLLLMSHCHYVLKYHVFAGVGGAAPQQNVVIGDFGLAKKFKKPAAGARLLPPPPPPPLFFAWPASFPRCRPFPSPELASSAQDTPRYPFAFRLPTPCLGQGVVIRDPRQAQDEERAHGARDIQPTERGARFSVRDLERRLHHL